MAIIEESEFKGNPMLVIRFVFYAVTDIMVLYDGGKRQSCN